MTPHTSPDDSGSTNRMKPRAEHTPHVLTPLRAAEVVTPSGYGCSFRKYTDDPIERPSFGICGNPSALELQQLRKALTLAGKPGRAAWETAIDLLRSHGWIIRER